MVAHGGGLPGWSTNITRFPEDRLTVIVLANRDSVDPGDLARQLAEPSLTAPDEPAGDAGTGSAIRAAIRALNAGKTPPGATAGIANEALFGKPADSAAFLRELGSLRALEQVATRKGPDALLLFRYRARFKQGTWTVVGARNGDTGPLTWLSLQPE
jgi:hypothetical protein